MKRMLVVDDEVNMQKVLGILFRREGYEVMTASNGAEALEILKKDSSVDLLLSDLKMPVMDGIELLKQLKLLKIPVPVILITAYGSITEAVDAMKMGAVDFITKPFNKEDLKNIVHRTVRGNIDSGAHSQNPVRNDEGVIYTSSSMAKILETVRKIAPSNLSILLTGESGTGKGIVAKAIHNYAFPGTGSRSPFISINCPALPDTLLESELFGYRKGAFTGAEKDFTGKISMANGGTLFLDEIGELSLGVQSKLLKLLEEGVYSPLGSTVEHKADIRILSATNQSIPKMISEKRFREDLYYRINSVILEIPPLRERKEDIEPLTLFFIKRFASENRKSVYTISGEAMDLLSCQTWPGNIRELRNTVHRAVVLSAADKLTVDDFPDFVISSGDQAISSFTSLTGNERDLVLATLNENSWNISASARVLGMSRGSLRHRINKYNLRSG